MRHRPIDLEPWRHEHQVRAFAKRRARRHRRAYAEGPCLIARRGDDASPRGIADRDWAASQGWIIALLDRRVEGVHVDVDDLACVGFAHGKSHINGIHEGRMGWCRSELSLTTSSAWTTRSRSAAPSSPGRA